MGVNKYATFAGSSCPASGYAYRAQRYNIFSIPPKIALTPKHKFSEKCGFDFVFNCIKECDIVVKNLLTFFNYTQDCFPAKLVYFCKNITNQKYIV